MFRSYHRMNARCDLCDFIFLPGRGDWTGAAMFAQDVHFVVAVIGFFVLLLLPPHDLAWAVTWFFAIVALGPILTYRYFKGFWAGVLFALGASRAAQDPTAAPPGTDPEMDRIWGEPAR